MGIIHRDLKPDNCLVTGQDRRLRRSAGGTGGRYDDAGRDANLHISRGGEGRALHWASRRVQLRHDDFTVLLEEEAAVRVLEREVPSAPEEGAHVGQGKPRGDYEGVAT